MATTLPETHRDLLEAPTFGVLTTVSPDGVPNATPMWFEWVDGLLRFTHTKGRKKAKYLAQNPNFSFTIMDPAKPYRYLEVRGVFDSIEDDPTGAQYVALAKRYGMDNPQAPGDAPERIILTLRPTHYYTK